MYLRLLLSKVIVHVRNSAAVLEIPRHHELTPGLRQCGSTTILAELDFLLELVVPPGTSSIFFLLVGPRRRNGREFVQSDRFVQKHKKFVQGYSSLVPSGLGVSDAAGGNVDGQISSVSGRGLANLVGGPFEFELGVPHIFGNVRRKGEQQDSHGIDKVAF